MKIYLDDVRELPEDMAAEGYVVVRSAEEALHLIASKGLENIEIISFDHDLGEDCMSGYDLASIIEEMVYDAGFTIVPEFRIHSANPVGRKNLERCFESITRRITNNPFTP
jgi:hypothetical protein